MKKLPQEKISNGKNLEYVVKQINEVMKENGLDHLPPKYRLEKLGYSNLATYIVRNHGGFRRFRELLGENQLIVENNAWKDLTYTIEQANKVMEENNLDYLPHGEALFKLGCSSLQGAIQK